MEGPCDERHTPAHSVMEVPMDVEDGAADISVADNLFGTSVTPPNLSLGAEAAVAPGAEADRSEAEGDGEGGGPPDVGRELPFDMMKTSPSVSELPYKAWKEKWV